LVSYETPGVYYERADVSAPVISAIRTDIAGFVGIAQRGLLDTPIPVESWHQFQAHFGTFTGAGFLAYTVRAFFENGGRRCWVVRVASKEPGAQAQPASVMVESQVPAGQPRQDGWRISASSPGVWGNVLSIQVQQTHRAQTIIPAQGKAPQYSNVVSTSGFTRAMMAQLTQGRQRQYKVISAIDPSESRLFWVNEDPRYALPYDSPLQGFDIQQPIVVESIEYTLIVKEAAIPIAIYERLALIPEHNRYGPRLLGTLDVTTNFQTKGMLPPSPQPIVIEEARNLPLTTLKPLKTAFDATPPLTGGTDGLAFLQSYDFIGEDISPLDSDQVRAFKQRGLRALATIDEVAIVAIPDIHIQPRAVPKHEPQPPCIPDPCIPDGFIPPASPRNLPQNELPPIFSESDIYQVQAAMVQHCEDQRDRIALLDAPFTASRNDAMGVGAIRAWRSRFDSKYATLYYPWLRAVDPLRSPVSLTHEIPPSGHIAGQYASTDLSIGVHKAPANSPLAWVQDVTVGVSEAVHGLLNTVGINVIKVLPGRGIRIFGARTISSDPDWRYVNIRRLMMMIEKAIDLSIQWAAFEPNDTYTRTKLHLSLFSFLIALWQQGALAGETAQEAFFVKCDEENNPPNLRANGQLIAEVGVAPAKPFEFIVVRVGRTNNEFEILDAQMQVGGGR
jgi:phage tail sheath protein FI